MLIRLRNDSLARMLHHFLYERMLAFNKQHCPEQPAEISVNQWLTRLYADDPFLHILVRLEDNYTIHSHAVIDVVGHEAGRVIVCHQEKADKPNIAHLDEGMRYIHDLAQQVEACSIVFFVEQHSKAFMKRYGFTTARTMMVKRVQNLQENYTQNQSRVQDHNGVLSRV